MPMKELILHYSVGVAHACSHLSSRSMRFSRRRPGETSEPVTEAEGGDMDLRKPSDLPTAGMQGTGAGSTQQYESRGVTGQP